MSTKVITPTVLAVLTVLFFPFASAQLSPSASRFLTQSCSNETSGLNQFCAPWPPVDVFSADFTGSVVVSASSSCAPNGTESFCYLSAYSSSADAVATNVTCNDSASCEGNSTASVGYNVTCESCPADSSAESLASGGQWLSALQRSDDEDVFLEVSFGRLMIVFSIELQFARPTTAMLSVERSVSTSSPSAWKMIESFSPRVNESGIRLELATNQSYYNAVQTNSSLSLLSGWQARRIRFVFSLSRNTTLADPATNETQFFHHSVSWLKITALCECNGHAAACNLTNATCNCQHDTDGDECESCANSMEAASPASAISGANTCSSCK